MRRIICLSVVFVCILTECALAEDPVSFTNADLKDRVELWLGIQNPTPTDMLGLTKLDIDPYFEITDLTGLEYGINLTYIDLTRNKVTDISALSGLTKLTKLYLSENQISDISALSGLIKLEVLSLRNIGIRNISALSGLTNLEALYLSHNPISDINALSDLTNLTELDLIGIPPSIWYDDGISDISALAGLIKLERLNLFGHHIDDISALSGLSNLTFINLSKNKITDIPELSGLANLTELYLYQNQINDISGLSELTNLTKLGLPDNKISDISALLGLSNLTFINLSDNEIIDTSALSELTNLRRLDLRGNPLSRKSHNLFPLIEENNPGVDIFFDPRPDAFPLTISSMTGGSVTVPGEGSFYYDDGASVSVTATLEANHHFISWTGTAVTEGKVADSISASTTLTVDGDYTLIANFEQISHDILYVDDNAIRDPGPNDLSISDPNEDGSQTHPFDSIQEAIDAARDYVTVLVKEGRYWECLDFKGKTLEVISFDVNSLEMTTYPIIDANDQGTCVTFSQEEDANCLLSGFVLTRGYDDQAGAIACIGSSPTIRNCLIVGNRCPDPNKSGPNIPDSDRAIIYCIDSNSLFENCTIADNYGGKNGSGICVTDCNVVLSNSIVWGNAPQQIHVVSGKEPIMFYTYLDIEPLFALPGYWTDFNDPNLLPKEPNNPNASWLEGDYHLQSLNGRYDPNTGNWVYDEVTSDCIDLGDPDNPVGLETAPHNDRLNVGAYGGTLMASRTGNIVFVTIPDDPGFRGSYGGFNGEISKYETTNAQYCQYLNAALSDGLIVVVDDHVVYDKIDPNNTYFQAFPTSPDSQITYANGTFTVRSRDSYSMANHPVVMVSWYGATAFAAYYSYHLPTAWEWTAVADYNGSYNYGCGTSIDSSKANYDGANPLGLTSRPRTSPVGYYPSYGYGLCDMAGNVDEWTSTSNTSGSSRVIRGGSWGSSERYCSLEHWIREKTDVIPRDTGFRVCR